MVVRCQDAGVHHLSSLIKTRPSTHISETPDLTAGDNKDYSLSKQREIDGGQPCTPQGNTFQERHVQACDSFLIKTHEKTKLSLPQSVLFNSCKYAQDCSLTALHIASIV